MPNQDQICFERVNRTEPNHIEGDKERIKPTFAPMSRSLSLGRSASGISPPASRLRPLARNRAQEVVHRRSRSHNIVTATQHLATGLEGQETFRASSSRSRSRRAKSGQKRTTTLLSGRHDRQRASPVLCRTNAWPPHHHFAFGCYEAVSASLDKAGGRPLRTPRR